MATYEEYEQAATPTGIILERHSWDKLSQAGHQKLMDAVVPIQGLKNELAVLEQAATQVEQIKSQYQALLDAITARATKAEAECSHYRTLQQTHDVAMFAKTQELLAAREMLGKAESRVAEAEQSEQYERADKVNMLREQNQPYYVPISVQLPAAGDAVLLQPFLESTAPEIGRLRYDEEGPYWQMNHARSMKYDLDNYQGWVYVPKVFVSQKDSPAPLPSSPTAAGPGQIPPYPTASFASYAEYEASVKEAAARIESGEIKPIEQEGGDND